MVTGGDELTGEVEVAGGEVGVGYPDRGVRDVIVPKIFRLWPLVVVPLKEKVAVPPKLARLKLLGGAVEVSGPRETMLSFTIPIFAHKFWLLL